MVSTSNLDHCVQSRSNSTAISGETSRRTPPWRMAGRFSFEFADTDPNGVVRLPSIRTFAADRYTMPKLQGDAD